MPSKWMKAFLVSVQVLKSVSLVRTLVTVVFDIFVLSILMPLKISCYTCLIVTLVTIK